MSGTDGFPAASEADWQALATRGGRTALSALTAHSDDGLPVGPLYTAGSGAPLPGRAPGSPWTVVQRIDEGSASAIDATARTALEGGATGLAIVFPDSATARGRGFDCDADALVRLAATPGPDSRLLRIEAGEATALQVADRLGDMAQAGARDICLAFDPVAKLAATGWLARSVDETIAALLAAGGAMDAAKTDGEAIIADGRPWHDGGASEAEELAAVLGATVGYLRAVEAQGCDLERAARRLGLTLSADADQFLTTAKFRAMRLLVARVFEASGLAGQTCRIHAESAWRMMSRRDSHLNMLRATSAVLAAAAGGADSVAVLPFDLGGDAFADRMARNAQTIARDEAALFRVGDPGAGSGAIETLTGQLAEAAWAAFQAIEADGGLLASVRSGTIQRRIAASRDERLRRVARREIDIVGVNVHIDRGRSLPDPVAPQEPAAPGTDVTVTADRLAPVRLAEPFETLCDQAHRLSVAGTPPTVFMAGLGADSSGAAGMAVDTLATAGVAATDAERHESPETACAAFRASGAVVACIVAGSDLSGEALAAVARAMKDAGALRILAFFAGEAPEGPVPCVDDIVGSRTDLAAVLGKLLDCVAIAGKNRQNPNTHQIGVGAAEL